MRESRQTEDYIQGRLILFRTGSASAISHHENFCLCHGKELSIGQISDP